MNNSLEGVLAQIPGLAGYLAKRQANEQGGTRELQQAGALQQILAQQQAAQKEQAFRGELQGLGQNPSQEALAQVAAKFSPAKDILTSQTASIDRQEATDARRLAATEAAAARKETAEANINLRYDTLAQRATDAEAQRKVTEARNAEIAANNKRHDETVRLLGEMRSGARIPPGYRKSTDGNLEAIPGGPADTKLQGVLNQDTASLQGTAATLDRLATAANEVKSHPGIGGITGLRGALPDVPGTAAANARAKLQTLVAQVGFGALQDMRNASKTGGALGQITEKEHVLLQNALAALATTQDTKQLQESLDKVIKFTEESKGRLRNAYNLKHGGREAGVPGTAPGGAVAVPTATGPNGEKIEFRNGQWQPVSK